MLKSSLENFCFFFVLWKIHLLKIERKISNCMNMQNDLHFKKTLWPIWSFFFVHVRNFLRHGTLEMKFFIHLFRKYTRKLIQCFFIYIYSETHTHTSSFLFLNNTHDFFFSLLPKTKFWYSLWAGHVIHFVLKQKLNNFLCTTFSAFSVGFLT